MVSSSEDRTCKVWSLSKGTLLRSIVFPSIIDAIALDPGEHVFYAGGRDGKVYIAALNAESNPNSSYEMYIIGSLPDHSKAVTCLAFSLNGVLLLSSYEDGMVRVWDTKTHNIVRIFRHAKQQGSSATSEMDMERLKLDCKKSMQMVQKWKQMYDNLHQFCVNELLDADQVAACNGNST